MPKIGYVGKDLEAMEFAKAYHEWILELIKPFLGKDLVEVGAGTGSFSKMLIETLPDSLALVEPSEMFHALYSNLSGLKSAVKVNFYFDTFVEAAVEITNSQRPDSILYLNVLEHIENDAKELSTAYRTLATGGRIFIFVPALPALFSKFDRNIGHFRRYRKQELKKLCETAGFEPLLLKWFDFAGILPWLIKYKILGSQKMEPRAVRTYDRFAVPLMRRLEKHMGPPIGKNLIYIGEKA